MRKKVKWVPMSDAHRFPDEVRVTDLCAAVSDFTRASFAPQGKGEQHHQDELVNPYGRSSNPILYRLQVDLI